MIRSNPFCTKCVTGCC